MSFKANDEARRNRLASMTDSRPADDSPLPRGPISSRAAHNSERRA